VHPDTSTSAFTVPAATKPVLQLSVAVAAPNDASIWACEGLHGTAVELAKDIVGACVSMIVIDCVLVAE